MEREPRRPRRWVFLRARAQRRLPSLALDLSRTPSDVDAVISELQLHQVELEMQHEQLRHTQRELDAVRISYGALFDAAPVGIFMLDRDGLVQSVNPMGLELLGEPSRRIRQRRFLLFVSEPSRPAFSQFFTDALEAKGLHQCQLILETKTSGRLPFLVSARAALSPKKVQILWLALISFQAFKEESSGGVPAESQ